MTEEQNKTKIESTDGLVSETTKFLIRELQYSILEGVILDLQYIRGLNTAGLSDAELVLDRAIINCIDKYESKRARLGK